MKKESKEVWEAKNDMPHEEYMDDFNIHYKQLPDHIQSKLKDFDKIYEKALKDGFVDEQEEKDIIHKSYEITQLLKQQFGDKNTTDKNGGNGVLGFLLGITLGVLGGVAVSQKGST